MKRRWLKLKTENSYLKKTFHFIKGFVQGNLPERNTPFCEECGGSCCRWGGGVMLRPNETKRFFVMLGADKRFFDDWGRLLFLEGQCPFLSEEGTCTCYDERPQVCRSWSCLYFHRNAWEISTKHPQVLMLIKEHNPGVYREIQKMFYKN